jgi:hypothetical protein
LGETTPAFELIRNLASGYESAKEKDSPNNGKHQDEPNQDKQGKENNASEQNAQMERERPTFVRIPT